jgi:hypothetical protein
MIYKANKCVDACLSVEGAPWWRTRSGSSGVGAVLLRSTGKRYDMGSMRFNNKVTLLTSMEEVRALSLTRAACAGLWCEGRYSETHAHAHLSHTVFDRALFKPVPRIPGRNKQPPMGRYAHVVAACPTSRASVPEMHCPVFAGSQLEGSSDPKSNFSYVVDSNAGSQAPGQVAGFVNASVAVTGATPAQVARG